MCNLDLQKNRHDREDGSRHISRELLYTGRRPATPVVVLPEAR
jgi:hypothetical protein